MPKGFEGDDLAAMEQLKSIEAAAFGAKVAIGVRRQIDSDIPKIKGRAITLDSMPLTNWIPLMDDADLEAVTFLKVMLIDKRRNGLPK